MIKERKGVLMSRIVRVELIRARWDGEVEAMIRKDDPSSTVGFEEGSSGSGVGR